LDASTNQKQIFEWWQEWPNANVGVATGKRSGIVVLDIDVKAEGPLRWRELQDINGAVDTLSTLTGSGGAHLIFESPLEPLRSTVAVIAQGIDTRAEGGYIVVPPSNHISGQRYEWDNRIKPAPVPEWLLALWPKHQVSPQSTNGNGHPPDPKDYPHWVSELLANGAPDGKRNNDAHRLAGYYRNKGIPRDIVVEIMQTFAAKCTPPMELKELQKTIDSAQRYSEGQPDAGETQPVQLNVTSLQTVKSEQVKPLRPKRIFLGKLAVIAGDPGLGKSYASLDIAARVSHGGPWPDGSGYAPRGNVLLLSAEDGLADTIKPRLELLGADMSRIDSLGLTVSKGEEEMGLSLQQHLPQIEREILQKEVILLVVDPLLAFTGKVDTHKTAEVRGLLSPLAAMAERTGCAVLGVMHPNKNSQEANLLYRISASLDFAAAARSVMVVAKHPDNPDQRVMATVKCNLSAHPEPMAFGFTHDGHFTWQGVTEVDVSQLMAPPIRDEDRNEREEAKEFLKTLLADGPVPANQVEEERKELGISSRTLARAKADLGITSERSGTEGKSRGKGKWDWYLPEHLPETFKDATPPPPTSGNLKNLERGRDAVDTKQGEMFKDATGNLKDILPGGNLKKPSPDRDSDIKPTETFKIANPGGRDVASLNKEPSLGTDSDTTSTATFKDANPGGEDVAILKNEGEDEETWVI
jgi:hypothetical protein